MVSFLFFLEFIRYYPYHAPRINEQHNTKIIKNHNTSKIILLILYLLTITSAFTQQKTTTNAKLSFIPISNSDLTKTTKPLPTAAAIVMAALPLISFAKKVMDDY